MNHSIETILAEDAIREPQIVLAKLIDPIGSGVVKIKSSRQPSSNVAESQQQELLQLLSTIGEPIPVYNRFGLWKPIGVDTSVAVDRAGGTGTIPVHIDLVNATLPPDFVAFFCERDDSYSGGQSVIAPFRAALRRLSKSTIAALHEIRISEGRFFDLSNVGIEINPFPLLSFSSEGLEWVRYTGKSGVNVIEGDIRALDKFTQALVASSITFSLAPGETFIVNQHMAAHGRTPLGLGQEAIRSEQRRFLWQVFIKASSTLADVGYSPGE